MIDRKHDSSLTYTKTVSNIKIRSTIKYSTTEKQFTRYRIVEHKLNNNNARATSEKDLTRLLS